MAKRVGGVALLALGVFLGCTSEATSPEGAAAISRVVPVAVPDMWCPAAPGDGQDSAAAKATTRQHPACDAKPRPASGRGSLTFVVDSTWAASDTTK